MEGMILLEEEEDCVGHHRQPDLTDDRFYDILRLNILNRIDTDTYCSRGNDASLMLIDMKPFTDDKALGINPYLSK
jgi:hypothetical protein